MSEAKLVSLSGKAIHGFNPSPTVMSLVQSGALPTTVRLGALPPKAGRRMLAFKNYYVPTGAKPAPGRYSISSLAKAVIAKMYKNDEVGDCVIAWLYKILGILSANDGRPPILVDDREVLQTYNELKAGPGDSGCIESDVLDAWKTRGVSVNGANEKIDDYLAIDWRDHEQVKVAFIVFGAIMIGFSIPASFMNSDVWRLLRNDPIEGGHCVGPIEYIDDATITDVTAKGVVVASWGRQYLFTWPAWDYYLSECYVILDQNWTGSDKLTPNGILLSDLKADIEKFRSGQLPDWNPSPVPPSPPVPPGPPTPPAPGPVVFPQYTGRIDPVTWTLALAPVHAGLNRPGPNKLSWEEFKQWCESIEQKLSGYFTSERVAEIMAYIGSEYVQGKDWKDILVDALIKFALQR